MAAARKTAAAKAPEQVTEQVADPAVDTAAQNTPPEEAVNPGAATSAAPGGAGPDGAPNTPPQGAAPGAANSAAPGSAGQEGVPAYRVVRPIRYGVKNEAGQVKSRTYRVGELAQLDDDTAAVLLVRGDVARQ